MKKNSELVQLLLNKYKEQINDKIYSGICSTVHTLLFNNSITLEEKEILMRLINTKGTIDSVKKKLYWWPLSDTQSRFQFLNELLKETLENENKKKEPQI